MKKTLYAEWVPFMKMYMLYEKVHVADFISNENIIDYVSDLDEAEYDYVYADGGQYEKLVLCDADTCHCEVYDEW